VSAPLVGLTSWRLPGTWRAAIARCASWGADGVQLEFGGLGRGPWLDDPGTLAALRAQARDRSVRLLAVAANCLNDIGLAAPRGTAQARAVDAVLCRALDTAADLSVPLVLVPSFRRSAIVDGDAFDRTVDALARAAAGAAERGLVLAHESVLPPRRARALLDRVGSPALRLALDTLNPVEAGQDPVEFVDALGDRLADQIHLKDGPPGSGESPLLGAGGAAVGATLDAVRRTGVAVRALVLENDYRDGRRDRPAADLAWARRQAAVFPPARPAGRPLTPTTPKADHDRDRPARALRA